MCGRFTLRSPANILVEQFRLATVPQLAPRFNIAPTQPVAVVRQPPGGQQRQLSLLRWGLIPAWAADPSHGPQWINARAESVAEKPAFRSAFKRRRCLVPADGYYEWQKIGPRKQPHYIRLRDGRPFAFAGLWEAWRGREGQESPPLETCAIITTQSNELTRPIHDRMPVILDCEDYELWLDPQIQDPRQLQGFLRPYDSARMAADPVSTYVNSVRHDDPQCIAIQRELEF